MNLGGLGLLTKTKRIFGKTYRPEKYWFNRGKTYIFENESNLPKDKLIQYLKTITFDSVLEFGCGWGKITKLILDNFKPNIYTAFDLSPHQLYNAKQECKNYNVNFYLSTILQFESERKFDLVIGTEVLLHVLPKDISNTIKNLLNFSKKYFIHIDPQYQKQENIHRTAHDFRHDYQQIYKKFLFTNYSTLKINLSTIHIIKITQQNKINIIGNKHV